METRVALSDTLEIPLRDFFPTGPFEDTVSQKRLKLEAETTSMLRGLTDGQLQVAIAQIKALGEL